MLRFIPAAHNKPCLLWASCKTSADFVLLRNIFFHLPTHEKASLKVHAVNNGKGAGLVSPLQNLILSKAHTWQEDGHAAQLN